MSRYVAFILLAALGAAAVSGCGEREQTASYKDGKYRGKPDGRPWDSQPPASVPGEWAKGDQHGWQKQMRARNDGQNENRRIGH
jgi:hypothetical protein